MNNFTFKRTKTLDKKEWGCFGRVTQFIAEILTHIKWSRRKKGGRVTADSITECLNANTEPGFPWAGSGKTITFKPWAWWIGTVTNSILRASRGWSGKKGWKVLVFMQTFMGKLQRMSSLLLHLWLLWLAEERPVSSPESAAEKVCKYVISPELPRYFTKLICTQGEREKKYATLGPSQGYHKIVCWKSHPPE